MDAVITEAIRVPGEEWEGVVAAADLAILPVGAVEWHGPHLPLGTDLILAEGFARAWADDGRGSSGGASHDDDGGGRPAVRAVLYPPVAYTACPGQTRGWPGTVAVRPETTVAYLGDVLEGILAAGFTRVLVVNGHDANMSTVRAAMEWASGRRRASLMLANWFQLVAPEETTETFGPLPSRGHGGAYETAGVMAFAPDAVRPDVVPDLPPRPKLGVAHPYVLVESAPTPWEGWSGHISLVSTERAAHVRELAAVRLGELITAWVAAPLPDAPRSAGTENHRSS
ncbi:creatininase family protein [Georgenia subflava]|uniref:Creatininase family protein n=1 Tax=Georgenia subflava TaxID=1622177 RepID=A0A6N7EBQ0_9MICO|nr:creatininase family protein [Georgenia subflava]MPV35549.1 creatininase family protein [Georgenia subflava]